MSGCAPISAATGTRARTPHAVTAAPKATAQSPRKCIRIAGFPAQDSRECGGNDKFGFMSGGGQQAVRGEWRGAGGGGGKTGGGVGGGGGWGGAPPLSFSPPAGGGK